MRVSVSFFQYHSHSQSLSDLALHLYSNNTECYLRIQFKQVRISTSLCPTAFYWHWSSAISSYALHNIFHKCLYFVAILLLNPLTLRRLRRIRSLAARTCHQSTFVASIASPARLVCWEKKTTCRHTRPICGNTHSRRTINVCVSSYQSLYPASDVRQTDHCCAVRTGPVVNAWMVSIWLGS